MNITPIRRPRLAPRIWLPAGLPCVHHRCRQRDHKGEATVTYDKVVRLSERNLPDVATRHVASVVFQYQPKVLAKERDRLENPFGFVVTAYRSDPEINTPAGTASTGAKP